MRRARHPALDHLQATRLTGSVHFLPINDPREPVDDLLGEQNAIIELVAAGAGLDEVLLRMAAALERLARPVRCTITVTERASGRVLHHAASSPPAGFGQPAIDGRERETEVVQMPFRRPLAESSWSGPLVDDSDERTAAIILHHREGLTPTPAEQQLVIDMTRLLRLALLRDHSDRTVRAARDQAEAALRLAALERDRLLSAIALMPEGFVLYDPDGRLVHCNEHYRGLYPESADLIVPGARFEDILRRGAERGQYAGAEQQVDAWVAERLLQHSLPSAEFEQEIAGGRWLRIQEKRLVDGSSVGLRIDITELKQREAASRLLFEGNPVPLVLIDPHDLRLLEANESALKHYRRTRADLQASTMFDLTPPEEHARVRVFFDQLPRTGEARDEWREARGGGRAGHVEVVASHIVFHGVAAILAAAVDVTDRRLAAERLHLSEERFRDFALTSSDWFWEQDADLRFCRFSDVADTPGLVHDQNIGRTRWEIVEAGVTEEQWREHKDALAARKPFRDFRYERRGTEGRMHQIIVSGVPFFDSDGNFRGYRGTGRDISEQVRAAEALRAAKEEAEAANRTKSQFLANMSHELRTPLNAVIGFSEVIRDMLMGPVDQRYRSYAADIHKAGHHLLGIINDVLDLSKVEVGRLELQEERVEIRRIVDTCLTLTSGAAETGRVSVIDMVPEGLAPVRADRLRLTQVLLNVLANAVKFTPPGGDVRIEASTADDGAFQLIVTDTGIGMRPEDIPVALSPFGQVDAAYARRVEGTGLGLPLAKTLTGLHGGDLIITSEPNVGTRVIIQLPASRVLAVAQPPSS